MAKVDKSKRAKTGKDYELDWDDYYDHDALNEVSFLVVKSQDINLGFHFH